MPTRREFLASAAVPALAAHAQAQSPKRLRRAECFFGIHLDLHPSKNDTVLGRDVTDAMVENFLSKIRPDYVQYDCKGHAGYMGYKSKVGTPSPGIVNDSLEVWRRVTARHGVGLFIHFSGVWDSLAVAQHPEWARVMPDGKPDTRQTSLWGPYVDELMIPQLKEAAERYDLDGAWVDGECWATNPDYSEAAARAFREATGIEKPPRSKDDPGWLRFLEFNRERFRQYVRHYVDVLHAARPQFQIASNWLYSTYVPEKPDLPVDFISGDYLGNASISTARLEARYMAQTGRPWDLMAWGFVSGSGNSIGPVHKHAVQLEQEAAVVLAQGGGFQVYYQPTRAGLVNDKHIGVMERLAKFCRARQANSHKSESVPQIGVLLSTHDLYNTTGKLFGGWGNWVNPARGVIDALIEKQYSVDVIPEWKLDELAAAYPVIVVPDWRDIGAQVRDRLVEYARAGGKLVLAGAETAALFRDHLGARFTGSAGRQTAYVPSMEVYADMSGAWQDVEPLEGTKTLLQRYPTHDDRRDAKCAATFASLGKGAIAAIFGPVGTVFALTHAPAVRDVFGTVVASVFKPAVRVSGPPVIEIALRQKGSKTLLHLLNVASMQVANDYLAVDFIPAVGPVEFSIELPRPPKAVTVQPDGKPLAGKWTAGRWTGTLTSVPIHAIIEFA